MYPGAETQLHRLLSQGKGARDQCLGGDDGCGGREPDHGVQEKSGYDPVEGIDVHFRMPDQQGALTEVIAQQGGAGKSKPGEANGVPAEVPEIGVQGFASRYAENHRTEDDNAVGAVAHEEINGMNRIQGAKDPRFGQDLNQAEEGDGNEPDHHDGTEQPADVLSAPVLNEEEKDEDNAGHGHDEGGRCARGHFQSFDGRKDGYRRRDDPVPVKETGAENAGKHERRLKTGGKRLPGGGQKAEKGEDASLAAIVGPQDEIHVLDADHDGHRPEDQGKDAQDVGRVGRNGMFSVKAFLDGVKGAGPDIAEDDADRSEGKKKELFVEST